MCVGNSMKRKGLGILEKTCFIISRLSLGFLSLIRKSTALPRECVSSNLYLYENAPHRAKGIIPFIISTSYPLSDRISTHSLNAPISFLLRHTTGYSLYANSLTLYGLNKYLLPSSSTSRKRNLESVGIECRISFKKACKSAKDLLIRECKRFLYVIGNLCISISGRLSIIWNKSIDKVNNFFLIDNGKLY